MEAVVVVVGAAAAMVAEAVAEKAAAVAAAAEDRWPGEKLRAKKGEAEAEAGSQRQDANCRWI